MRCEITVDTSFVVVNILRGRNNVRVFVNDVEQIATEKICEFFENRHFHEKDFFFQTNSFL